LAIYFPLKFALHGHIDKDLGIGIRCFTRTTCRISVYRRCCPGTTTCEFDSEKWVEKAHGIIELNNRGAMARAIFLSAVLMEKKGVLRTSLIGSLGIFRIVSFFPSSISLSSDDKDKLVEMRVRTEYEPSTNRVRTEYEPSTNRLRTEKRSTDYRVVIYRKHQH
jgi:hypothetical protein